MATEMQKKAIDTLVEKGGTVAEAMRAAGYSENTIKTPGKLTKSDGFKDILEKAGLTHDLVATALAEDIKAKPGKRVQELGLAANVLKMTGKESDGGDKNVTINFISFNS